MLMSDAEQGSVETVVGGANETPPLRWVTKCQATVHLRKLPPAVAYTKP
jgi:hypothetical protein